MKSKRTLPVYTIRIVFAFDLFPRSTIGLLFNSTEGN